MSIISSPIARRITFGVLAVVVVGIGGLVAFKDDISIRFYGMMHDRMHSGGEHQSGHDMSNMPGLRGINATPEETADLAEMFGNFETFTREVTNLPNGIRTITRSSDPDVMAALVSHVAGMTDRVTRGDDPQILIQSPTLDIFFERGEGITSDITVTDEGIVVIRTSDDPEIVAAMHIHAAEVSDMAARGMDAVHDAMAKNTGN